MIDPIFDTATNIGYDIASIVGTLAFAISGFLMGVRHRLDAMGLFIVSALPAVGGGILRDTLVNRLPATLVNPEGFFLVILAVLCSFLFRLHKIDNLENRFLFVISDSLGLVAFSITGAMVGIQTGFNIFGVVILAFLTAVGGGIIRDILVNDVPVILQKGFYGSIAVIIAGMMYGLNYFQFINVYTTFFVFLCGITLRLVAYFYRWNLPKINY